MRIVRGAIIPKHIASIDDPLLDLTPGKVPDLTPAHRASLERARHDLRTLAGVERDWAASDAVRLVHAFDMRGGRYIVRSGQSEAIEGEPPGRLVILEFPDRAAAKAWRSSPAYQAILPIRDSASTSRVYVVEGVAP